MTAYNLEPKDVDINSSAAEMHIQEYLSGEKDVKKDFIVR